MSLNFCTKVLSPLPAPEHGFSPPSLPERESVQPPPAASTWSFPSPTASPPPLVANKPAPRDCWMKPLTSRKSTRAPLNGAEPDAARRAPRATRRPMFVEWRARCPARAAPKIGVCRIRTSSVPCKSSSLFFSSWVDIQPEYPHFRVTCQPKRAKIQGGERIYLTRGGRRAYLRVIN